MAFQKATKKKAKLRLALIGPSGSGKTFSALAIATGLGEKIALIDTEHGSASKYSDRFNFDVLELTSFAPERYIEGIKDAAQAGYDVLIIDSLSHAWAGKDGILEFVDKRAKASDTGNSFGAWRDATPKHNALVEAILAAPMDLIVTVRSKTEYVLEKNDKGKTVPRKVGLQPVQRDGLEYEFDVVGDMKIEGNDLVVSKSRCSALTGEVISQPGKALGQKLRAWLSEGVDAPAPQPTAESQTQAAVIADAVQAVVDQDASTTVTGVKEGGKAGWYVLSLADGRECWTKDADVVAWASDAKRDGTPVRVSSKKDNKGYEKLIVFAHALPVVDVASAPVSQDVIPF